LHAMGLVGAAVLLRADGALPVETVGLLSPH
jgi:hypothetical protein